MYKSSFFFCLCLVLSSCTHQNCFYDQRGTQIAAKVSDSMRGFDPSQYQTIASRENYIRHFEDLPNA